MTQPTETRMVDVGDAEIHVEITGNGPDLLLVAGLGGRGAFWNNQVQDFAGNSGLSHLIIVVAEIVRPTRWYMARNIWPRTCSP